MMKAMILVSVLILGLTCSLMADDAEVSATEASAPESLTEAHGTEGPQEASNGTEGPHEVTNGTEGPTLASNGTEGPHEASNVTDGPTEASAVTEADHPATVALA